MLAYGPVPSRRLGRSLGINNIPVKHCTYSCVYCQLGFAAGRECERRAFYKPEEIFDAVAEKVSAAKAHDEKIDYLTFVPDGEPTLDINLGRTAGMVKELGIPIAIISNGSLLYRDDVREDLALFDWVSVKFDSASERVWRKIDRPAEELDFGRRLEGIRVFRSSFDRLFCTETMLVEGYNDDPEEWKKLGPILKDLDPEIAYVGIPTRPPALPGVHGPGDEVLAGIYETLSGFCRKVEFITGYEGDTLSRTGDPVEDLWAITMVHPIREAAALKFLSTAQDPTEVLALMVEEGKIKKVRWQGINYFLGKPAHP